MSGRELRNVVGNALAHRGAFAVVDLEALLLKSERKSAHGSDEEVGTLYVPGARGDFARRLDNEDAMCLGLCRLQCTDVAIELIAKNPNGAKLGRHRYQCRTRIKLWWGSRPNSYGFRYTVKHNFAHDHSR